MKLDGMIGNESRKNKLNIGTYLGKGLDPGILL